MKKLFNGLETNYLDGFQYKFTHTWEAPSGTMTNDEMKLRIIPTSEGYYDALRNVYFYNYTDHLGNVRLSYSDRDGNNEVTGDIVVNNCYTTPEGQMCNNYILTGEAEGVTNYYPFGMMHTVEYNTFDNPYQYKYNGKELQETGMYDYGARFYMPDIGRWGVVDPLAEITPHLSSYHYANNNPVRFTDPDGRHSWDNLTTYNPGSAVASFLSKSGFSDDHLPMLFSDDSGIMIVNHALGNDGQGGGLAVNIILNFIRNDKKGLGNFINSEFEENGWHVIDATSLADALTKLASYLGDSQADNIYINAHGYASQRWVLDDSTSEYKAVGDTGFYTGKDGILGSHMQQYISDKNKLSPNTLESIDSFIGISNHVKEGKNLIMGSCNSARYDDLFGNGISSIVKSRDIFVNRDYSSLWPIGGKVGFKDFIGFNQTSKHKYINGWVRYRDGASVQQNFNIIMTKYGVKTIK